MKLKRTKLLYKIVKNLTKKVKSFITFLDKQLTEEPKWILPIEEPFHNPEEPLFLIVEKSTKMIVGAYSNRETAEFEMVANRHSKLPREQLEIHEIADAPTAERDHLLEVYDIEPEVWN